MRAYRSAAYMGRAYVKKGSLLAPPDPGSRDPLFPYVSFLYHAEGINNGTVFTESSSFHHALTQFGGAVTSTDWSRAGLTSQKNASVGDWVQAPSHASLNLASGDWTIELSFKATAFAPNIGGNYLCRLLSKDNVGQREYGVYLQGTASSFDSLRMIIFTGIGGGSGFIAPLYNFNFLLNVQYDIAIVCHYGQIQFFVNGAPVMGPVAGAGMGIGNAPTVVGSSSYTGYTEEFFGYIDEVRITKGIGRYTAAYTPVFPFPNSI